MSKCFSWRQTQRIPSGPHASLEKQSYKKRVLIRERGVGYIKEKGVQHIRARELDLGLERELRLWDYLSPRGGWTSRVLSLSLFSSGFSSLSAFRVFFSIETPLFSLKSYLRLGVALKTTRSRRSGQQRVL